MSEYCSDSFRLEESEDSFRMWQGLVGPYFQPRLSADGTLSWSNNGGLQNPETVNIRGPQGAGIRVAGIAEDESGLPAQENAGGIWLVGTDLPYEGWAYINGEWIDLGPLTVGPAGPPGPQGDDYELTEGDKAEIAGLAVDQFSLLLENDPLPVQNGGTGARTVEDAQTALGIGEINDKLGTWPLGTDAQDVAGAVNELIGKADADYAGLHGEISAIPKPNLVDNWYFVGGGSQLGNGVFPINQRSQTSYSSSGFCIDRWNLVRGSLTLQSNGLLCASPSDNTFRIEHPIPYGVVKDLLGKTCTYSALVNNTLCTFTAIVSEDALQKSFIVDGNTFNLNINFDANWGNVRRPVQFFVGTAQSLTVKAVKFEIGSTQTLAHQVENTWVLNEIPDYGEQLAKCQRYLVVEKATASYRVGLLNTNGLYFTIPLPQPLVKVPSITGIAVDNFPNMEVSGFTFSYYLTGNNSLRVVATKDNHGLTDAAIVLTAGAIVSAE